MCLIYYLLVLWLLLSSLSSLRAGGWSVGCSSLNLYSKLLVPCIRWVVTVVSAASCAVILLHTYRLPSRALVASCTTFLAS
jgi:Mn2+/Fe2+ NRAMP family transporter